jgi:hypothetical protein
MDTERAVELPKPGMGSTDALTLQWWCNFATVSWLVRGDCWGQRSLADDNPGMTLKTSGVGGRVNVVGRWA